MSSDSNLTGLKRIPRIYPIILWLLTLSFFLRVLGQILIAFFQVSFLPPMPHWYSGLLSYPILLCLQILILIIQIKINLDFSQSSGYFAQPKPKFGNLLLSLRRDYGNTLHHCNDILSRKTMVWRRYNSNYFSFCFSWISFYLGSFLYLFYF